jgi:benzoyl-CoA reductase/2-hydroxyglutaryl-CoA dehydratase subunit BcrC/BadD/HgdB
MGVSDKIKENLKQGIQRNLDRNYISRVLNLIGLRPILSTYGSTFSSSSDKYLNIASIKSLKKAYNSNQPVAFGSLFFSHEFFHALGIVPFLPEVMAGFTAGLGLADRTLKEASSRWYTPDLCTFHRSASGAVEMDLFPEPKFIIVTNLACDAAQKTFYIDAKKYGVEKNYFLIDVPYEKNEKNISYLAKQLEETAENICRKLGRKTDPEKFSKVIELSNEFRSWAVKINEIRLELTDYPKNFNGLNFILPFHALAGTTDAVQLYREIYNELSNHLENQKKDMDFKKILWLHLKPYYKNNIFNILQDNNYIVAFEEINYVYWPELDPKKPFESLALKMLSHPLNGSIQNRVDAVVRMALEYKIDGVILFSHWGCRHSNGGGRIIKDSLKDINVPALILDGDCLNKNNSSEGQIYTRLQGFMEIINARI